MLNAKYNILKLEKIINSNKKKFKTNSTRNVY